MSSSFERKVVMAAQDAALAKSNHSSYFAAKTAVIAAGLSPAKSSKPTNLFKTTQSNQPTSSTTEASSSDSEDSEDSEDSNSSDMDEKEDQVESTSSAVAAASSTSGNGFYGIHQVVVPLKKERDMWKDTVTTVRSTLNTQVCDGWSIGVFFAGRSDEADKFLNQLKSSLSNLHDVDYKEWNDQILDGTKTVRWREGPRTYYLLVLIWDKIKDERLGQWSENSLYFQSPTFYTCPMQHALIMRGCSSDCLVRFQTGKERA